ncbi:elongator complex protein 4 [Anthonomus grandis grandis]|uniref:elongator complex protein 4 n=1 Tax=Anthonomus grandis grandis TaxID=2921223 RepID=UPI0021656EF4|nr:elongator complex protein 4 [Anthonomus grandis grandis]
MEKKKDNLIPGTVLSTSNGQLMVSSGVASLDHLLGGLPVGTVALVEEDLRGLHSKVILKYFLAEGLVSKHSLFVASQDVNPTYIVRNLPAVIESDPEKNDEVAQQINSCDKLKIAFRYQNVSKSPESQKMSHFGHHFDLSKSISLSDIENSDIFYWTGQRIEGGFNTFLNPAYNDLLKSIRNKIKDGHFFLKDNPEKKTILRIGIHSLGSPMWLSPKKSIYSLERHSQDLHMFIFCLRALVRSAHAVAMITIPSYLYDEDSVNRCIHSSDIAIKLQSFSGTELEKNQSLQDYQGFFYLTKLAAINSLTSKHIGAEDYAFKLRKKKFSIEMLHLPPDIGDDTEKRKDKGITLGCGGDKMHLLDF